MQATFPNALAIYLLFLRRSIIIFHDFRSGDQILLFNLPPPILSIATTLSQTVQEAREDKKRDLVFCFFQMLDNNGREKIENEAKQVQVVGDGVKEDEGC